ncbi:tryptophan--tRNA ligase [Candidatus Saccharibacteria bacterium]|nr:tryptophan--tRNA ligase [Candidatus Saccharibacteria bacterium]
MVKDVILTGLRANAEFHLGNYLGGILPMVQLQKRHAGEYQLNMFIPDLHSFTTPIDHGALYEQTHQNLKVFVAAELDIDQPDTFIYRQSYIPAHSELTWILDCFTGFGEMSRMTEFKDKAKQIGEDRISVGLFNYPVLMAADILIYGAKYVPVGEDQRQHVEFARDIAMRINNKFGDIFVLPADNNEQLKFAGREKPVRIRSLRNPERKMSKSVEDPAGTIMLSDKPQDGAKKIMAATTDNLEKKVLNPNFESRPGIANLLQILKLLKPDDEHRVSDLTYEEFKVIVAETVSEFLKDLQIKLAAIDDKQLMQKLEADEEAMRKVADATLLRVQKAVGLRPA